jgi:hypothetical protein
MRLVAVSLIVAFVILVAACSGEEETPNETSPSPTTATPSGTREAALTPSAEATPLTGSLSADFASFRAFAAEVDAAVSNGDAAFFANRGVEIEVVCRGDEQLGQCMNQPPGTVIRGIQGAAWQSDASALVPRAEYEQLVSEWFTSALPSESDSHGDGPPRLLGLAQSFEGEPYAITSLIRDAGASSIERQCRVFRFSLVDGNWVLLGEYFCYATVTTEDWLSGKCAECYDYWEPWEGP